MCRTSGIFHLHESAHKKDYNCYCYSLLRIEKDFWFTCICLLPYELSNICALYCYINERNYSLKYYASIACEALLICGNFTVTTKRSAMVSTENFPLQACVKLWAIDRPKPLPPSLRLLSPRTKRSI